MRRILVAVRRKELTVERALTLLELQNESIRDGPSELKEDIRGILEALDEVLTTNEAEEDIQWLIEKYQNQGAVRQP